MNLRERNIETLRSVEFDVLIVGGGINGAVSAAALAARGVSVALIDKKDFASETSSQSSNLVWGGIKYLETHEYLLVNKLCKSRNQLMSSYPTRVKEIRFLTTIQRGFRFPALFIYLGTLLYWLFGRFKTRAPNFLRPKKIKRLEPAIDTSNAQGGFEYSDAYLCDNDARFVFDFVKKALDKGASCANYLNATSGKRQGEVWNVVVEDQVSGEKFNIVARSIVNACGPYADIFNQTLAQQTEHHHVFSKGIHLIVDRITPSEKVLAFFAADGRLFFVIPMANKTCIGTTDTQVERPSAKVSAADRKFVLDNANNLLDLDEPLSEQDIISERCGVRPLAVAGKSATADWVKLSRKHNIDVNHKQNYASIFGGKLTDCVNVGEEVVEIVRNFGIDIPREKEIWFGEDSAEEHAQYKELVNKLGLGSLKCTHNDEFIHERLWRRYGKNATPMLEKISEDKRQAENIFEGVDFLRCELRHVAEHEMVSQLDDFLRRRSNISLLARREQIRASEGLEEVCDVLFGDKKAQSREQYLNLKTA